MKKLIPLTTLVLGLFAGFFIAKCTTNLYGSEKRVLSPKQAMKKSEIAFNEVARFDNLMKRIPGNPVTRYRAVTYRVDSLMALLNKYEDLKKDIINSSGNSVLGDTSKYIWKVGFYPSITDDTLFTINIIPTVMKVRMPQQVDLPYTDNHDYYDFLTHFEGKSPPASKFPDLYKKSNLYVYDYGTLIP